MYRLTKFSKSSGCGCKLPPLELQEIKEGLFKNYPSNLLVGHDKNDDAAIFKVSEELAIINTVDFFTPIVDNPIYFGAISAVNALSDVYSMGGKPLFVNAILGWPLDELPLYLVTDIINGASDMLARYNISIGGGHSINITEPVFGFSVTGTINPKNIKLNSSAKEGDLIYLTKPLGVGFACKLFKRDKIKESDLNIVVQSMLKVNRLGEFLGDKEYVHSMTDVTGFGLAGHLLEMCEGSDLTAKIDFSKIKYFEFLDRFLPDAEFPDNAYRNWNSYDKKISGMDSLSKFGLLNDPQTSGGLLISVDPNEKEAFTNLLIEHNLEDFTEPIGVFVKREERFIYL